MGKYSSSVKDVFSVFGSSDWVAQNIKTVPADFSTDNLGNEFIRVSVLPSGPVSANPLKSVSGMLMIEIFTPAGFGPNKVMQTADKLDTFLAGKTIKQGAEGQTQFLSSNLSGGGLDSANPSLFRAIYSIQFNYFGA